MRKNATGNGNTDETTYCWGPVGPGFHFRGIYYYVSKVEPTQASTIRKSLVLYRERGGVHPCVVLYCGPQWYYGKRRLIFMPVPVVQTELIWTETRIKLSLVGPSPWLLPLGAGRRWAGKDGHNTSPRRRRSVLAYCSLAPFRSIKRSPPPPVPHRDLPISGTKKV